MVSESLFNIFIFIFYAVIFMVIYLFLKRIISKNGFTLISVFVLTFSLFYLIVPFVQILFPKYRDNTSLFTQLLNQRSQEEIFLNVLIVLLCLLVVLFGYSLKMKSESSEFHFYGESINFNKRSYERIQRIADAILIIGVSSIVILIIEVGSIKDYLSLGSLTRGINKDPTMYVRSSFLQLITLSLVILVTPYLYLYLYRLKKQKIVLIKFIIALSFSILFLLYNQGRAPLLLFFLPFLFTLRKNNKQNIGRLGIFFIIAMFLLNYLDAIFKYLSYGTYVMKESGNFLTEFLSEFSYPFTNFVLRGDLIGYSGYRFFYDYFIWPFTMIPSSVSGLLGFEKSSLVAVSIHNTNAYGYFLGVEPDGGIPVDFLTFNFYQFGYISLLLVCFIIGILLKKLDEIFIFYRNNFAIKVILFRISFSMINILNNADISAIVRNRLDIVLLVVILIYIYRKDKQYLKL